MQSLLTLDGTVVVQVVNFVGFLGVLNFVYLRPAGKALAARRAHINAISSDYEQALLETQALQNAGEAQRQAVRRECEELLTQARTQATSEAEDISLRVSTLAQERTSTAHATVALEVTQAEQREAQLTEEIAGLLLSRAIGETR